MRLKLGGGECGCDRLKVNGAAILRAGQWLGRRLHLATVFTKLCRTYTVRKYLTVNHDTPRIIYNYVWSD